MADTTQTPAHRIVARFGAWRLAAWTGRHRSRIHAWTWPISKGGTGGVVPHRLRAKIIQGAKADLDQVVAYADFEPQGDEAFLFDKAAA